MLRLSWIERSALPLEAEVARLIEEPANRRRSKQRTCELSRPLDDYSVCVFFEECPTKALFDPEVSFEFRT
jgi:hypothetical protein